MGLELAIGAVVLLAVAVACFAAYSRVEAHTAVPRIAIGLAEYLSREEAPDAAQLDALATFLRDHELGAGNPLLAVITALRREVGDTDPTVLWEDTIALGDAATTTELARLCTGLGAGDPPLEMDEVQNLFVVEVCARSGGTGLRAALGDLHYRYLLPGRNPDVIPDPPMRPPPGSP